MRKIHVDTAFNLLESPGAAPRRFEVGEHEVEDHIADHWYVQQHLKDGGPTGAKLARDAADAAYRKAAVAIADYQRLEDAAHQAEVNAGLEPSAPAHERLAEGAEEHEAEVEAEAEPDAPEDLTEKSATELVEWLDEHGYTRHEVTAETPLPELLETAQGWQTKLAEEAAEAIKAAAPARAAAPAPAPKTPAKKAAPKKPAAKKTPAKKA